MDAAGAMLGPMAAAALLFAAPQRFDLVFVVSFSLGIVGLAVLVLFVRNPGTGPIEAQQPAPRRRSLGRPPARARSLVDAGGRRRTGAGDDQRRVRLSRAAAARAGDAVGPPAAVRRHQRHLPVAGGSHGQPRGSLGPLEDLHRRSPRPGAGLRRSALAVRQPRSRAAGAPLPGRLLRSHRRCALGNGQRGPAARRPGIRPRASSPPAPASAASARP